MNADAPFGVSPQVLSSLLRISTHPRVYVNPSGLEEAVAFCDAILEAPTCSVVQPRERHWSIFTDLCRQGRVKGNLVQDAWFAALAIEPGLRMDYHRSRLRAVPAAALARAVLITVRLKPDTT